MKIKKYAAIDIGSNAVRLLISTITEVDRKRPYFKKTAFVRVPIRLGDDAFVNGRISQEKCRRMLETMKAFKMLMDLHDVEHFQACATSAMRDAGNSQDLVSQILKETGIPIEIIDGNHEASIIASTNLYDFIKPEKTYLYVDVGGGSTEFTIFSNGKPVVSNSFNIGTIRLMNDLVTSDLWAEAEQWIHTHTADYDSVYLIGSGGNINHLFKASGKKAKKPLTYFYLGSYYQLLNSLNYEERVSQLRMKLDRADVIVPATKIYLSAMKWCGARKIYVPKIGLADGIIKSLYNHYKAE